MKHEIGVVTLKYDEKGAVVSSNFEPTITLEASDSLIEGLSQVKSSEDSSKIINHARNVFSSWFDLMTQIELNDEYTITTETLLCEKYESGLVSTCKVKFYYEH